ncbi:hypothetical protein [Effusibacillus consociatus]|uniref:Citrate transporter-like domain-containing protein n=1 Tax=Effusibacillus consociatus TaxID=1117041 RepID=A0ABV9QCD2_9BACL
MSRHPREGTVCLSLLALAFLHLIDVFIPSSWSHLGTYGVLLFLLVSGLFLLRGIPLVLSCAMLLAGHSLLFLHGGTFQEWGNSITKNVPLLSLLILVPLLQIPFQAGGYLDAVEEFVRRSFDSKQKVVNIFGAVVFVVGSLLNLGGLRFLSSLAGPMYERYGDLVLRTMCRSFVSSILWSPYFATVGLTLVYLHLPVQTFLPSALALALFSLIGGIAYTLIEASGFAKKLHSAAAASKDETASSSEHHMEQSIPVESRRKLFVFLLLLVLLLAAALTIEHITQLSMLTVISVLALVFPLMMAPFVNRQAAFHGVDGYRNGLSKLVTEVMLFTSAGFLGGVLSTLDLGTGVAALYAPLAAFGSYTVILALVLTVLLLSLALVHPILTVTVLLTSIPPDLLGLHPIAMGLSVLTGWSLAMTVSVITPFIVIISGIFDKTMLEAGWRQNKWYMMVMALFLSAGIWVINKLLA